MASLSSTVRAESRQLAVTDRRESPLSLASSLAWFNVVCKLVTIVLAIFPLLAPDLPQFQGKWMAARSMATILFVVLIPSLWWLRGQSTPYPHLLDVLVVLAIVVDMSGNALNLYDTTKGFDLVTHLLGWTILIVAFGLVISTLPLTRLNIVGPGHRLRGNYSYPVENRRIWDDEAWSLWPPPHILQHNARLHSLLPRHCSRRSAHYNSALARARRLSIPAQGLTREWRFLGVVAIIVVGGVAAVAATSLWKDRQATSQFLAEWKSVAVPAELAELARQRYTIAPSPQGGTGFSDSLTSLPTTMGRSSTSLSSTTQTQASQYRA